MDQEIAPPNSTNPNTNNNNNINNPSKPSSSSSSFERKISSSSSRPQKAAPHVNCPRCDSTNTKFCYYNNYSLSQPRYFCKTCRRYWTEGGTLRNIPVGGGSRKNKRSSSSSYHTSKNKLPHDLFVPPASTSVLSQNPRMQLHHHHGQGHYGQDLNLGFPLSSSTTTNGFKNVVSEYLQVPNNNLGSATTTTGSAAQFSAAMNSFMPIPIPMMPEFKIPMMPEFKIPTSSIGFSLDGMNIANGNGGLHQEGNAAGGRLLFPFEELKANTETTTHDDESRDDEDQNGGDSNGYWNGMLGGGSW